MEPVNAGQSGDDDETVNNNDESNTNNNKTKSHMIVVIDACLSLLALGEAPVSARVLINYELPSKVLFCCSTPLPFLFVHCTSIVGVFVYMCGFLNAYISSIVNFLCQFNFEIGNVIKYSKGRNDVT